MRPIITAVCIFLIISCNEKVQKPENELLAKARDIHENVITIDTHNDIDVRNFTDSVNYTQRLGTQVNLPKMKEGGLDVSWLIVYTGQDSLTEAGYAKARDNAMAKFDAIHRLCTEIAPDEIELARTSEDVRRIHSSGKKVAMIGVENAYPIGEDLAEFERYHEMGARYISLSHNEHSQFCDSNTGEGDGIWFYNGLSELGKQALNEINRLGIIVDISHVSKVTTDQILTTSKAPVIASHSSARSLCNHSRNMDDESLKLLAENGGVVQTVALSAYIHEEKHAARDAYMQSVYKEVADSIGSNWYKWNEFANNRVPKDPDTPPAVNVSDFIDHIDYMVKLIGIEHVGISSDFDGGGGIEGWSDASETLNITLELVKRGYTEEEISMLWGENLMRVLDDVQKVAAEWPSN